MICGVMPLAVRWLYECDAHGHEGGGAAAHLPKLRDVDAEICERVHGKNNHVGEVGNLDSSPLQPFVLVWLQLLQGSGFQAQRAQVAPREVVVFHVLPGEHHDRLFQDAKQLDALQRRHGHL